MLFHTVAAAAAGRGGGGGEEEDNEGAHGGKRDDNEVDEEDTLKILERNHNGQPDLGLVCGVRTNLRPVTIE